MEEVVDLILKGVSVVPKCGYPGSLVVFDQNAVPILTGDTTCSVVFAAAKYGQGRIFATGHEAYIHHFIQKTPDFLQLWHNIKGWLLNHRLQVDDADIPNIDSYELVADIPEDIKLLKWIGTVNKTELFIHQLLKKYVYNGGSIICGICPWGWLSISHGRTLDDMSLNKFLSSCGINFSANVCVLDKRNYFSVAENLAAKSHIGQALISLNQNIATATKNKDLIINGIDSLEHGAAVRYIEKLNKILISSVTSEYRPTYKASVFGTTGISLLSIASKVYQKSSQCGIEIKAPNLCEFPGDFLDNPPKVTAQVEIKSKFNEFHCTGYYVESGTSMKVTVLEGSTTGWDLRVGCHTDDLSSMESLRRWPLIFSRMKLKRQMTVTTAFGGVIYLESPNGNSVIKIKLENVVETPHLDLSKPGTIQNWKDNSQSAGLWAEICGKNIAFTVPSHIIRALPAEDLSKALGAWDLVIVANHELRGTDAKNCCRERVVIDVQPFGNRIHSGYPVVIPYHYILPSSECFIFDIDKIRQNGWNLIHELSHNMTRSYWTPRGAEEVTVNIFTLHAFHLVFNQKPDIRGLIDKKLTSLALTKYANADFSFVEWTKNPYIGLLIYAQLVNAFGWDAFKIVFREYESLAEKEFLIDDLTKWDEWIIRFSNIVGLDVSPLFLFWNIPFTEKTLLSVNDLTPWLPNDEISKIFVDRVNYVKMNYKPGMLFGNEGLYSSCPRVMYPEDFRFDSIDKLELLKPKKISVF